MMHKPADLENGQMVWGCAYALNSYLEGMALKCEPVLGVVEKYGKHNGYFYKIKKDGTPYQNSVELHSRLYADTKEESIQLYNKSVEDAADRLLKISEKIRQDKIEVIHE